MFKQLCPLILSLCILVGCSSRDDTATVEIQPEQAAQTIMEQVEFRDALVKAEGDVAANLYQLDDVVADHAIYVSGTGATAEEVAVLKLAEGASLDDARAIIDTRVEDLIFSFRDYVPAEMTKLEHPVIVGNGDVIVLVLADDASAAQAAVDGLFA